MPITRTEGGAPPFPANKYTISHKIGSGKAAKGNLWILTFHASSPNTVKKVAASSSGMSIRSGDTGKIADNPSSDGNLTTSL
jgi:hypothetical protein